MAEEKRRPSLPDGDYSSDSGTAFVVMAALHVVCCGLPLLLLSGVSLAFVAPYWPVAAGILAVLGIVGFAWYLRRGCATCPRNEGRCQRLLLGSTRSGWLAPPRSPAA